MSSFKKSPATAGRPRKDAAPKKDPFASLRMAEMVISKPHLPLEILALVVDHLTVPDLIRFARVSRRMQEMVYEDTRWIQRLKKMGYWDEAEARKQNDAAVPLSPRSPQFRRQSTGLGNQSSGQDASRSPSNPGLPTGRGLPSQATHARRRSTLKPERFDGFEPTPLSAPLSAQNRASENTSRREALYVLKKVRSIRGKARQEYGKVYGALAPFYNDIMTTQGSSNYKIFKIYSLPEEQAQMLFQLEVFSRSDFAQGANSRYVSLQYAISAFETAALGEFRLGYGNRNKDGTARKYALVLATLNGGQASTDHFIHFNKIITDKASLGSPSDCLDYSTGRGIFSLERTQSFFDKLTTIYLEEVTLLEEIFPNSATIALMLLEKVSIDLLSPFLTTLYDDIHGRGVEMYLQGVAGTFAQSVGFMQKLPTSGNSSETFHSTIRSLLTRIFEPHVDLYLAEELEFFKKKSESEVNDWDKALSEQAASTETFLMSNINRQADKKDFLTSFKKVVMMPVTILPTFPTLSSNKSTAKALVNGESIEADKLKPSARYPAALASSGSSTPAPQEAPTTELAAKAAVMNSKLEGIRSLFSIEVALTLVHTAKQSIERAAQFAQLDGITGQSSKTQCSAIFITLLHVLGTKHVRSGFDKAVTHLSSYNPRSLSSDEHNSSTTVQPLATFLELVNVGDLIQQMLDVFYEQELIAARLTDRSDFLDPTNKEKKKFEQMLDERVAAGLNKGIDVLIDEVEYLCATTQSPTDYNPAEGAPVEVGPTETSTRIVNLVSTHLNLLTGATDKTLLDVFATEVGLRLFAALCKHLKRQRISTTGSLRLISDVNAYYAFAVSLSLRNGSDLLAYFAALTALSQIYLIDGSEAKGVAEVVSDVERWKGVFRPEEVLEFAERRADWLSGGVKGKVERAMFGENCAVM